MKQYFFDRVIMLNISVLAGVNILQLTQLAELVLLIISIIYTILKAFKYVDGDGTSDNIVKKVVDKILKKKQ